MLKTRVLTTLVGVPVMVFLIYQGGYYWLGLFFVMAISALYEYYRMMQHKQMPVLWFPGYLLMLLLLFYPVVPEGFSTEMGILVVLFMMVFVSVVQYPRVTIREVAINLFGPLYFGFLLQYTVRVMSLEEPFLVMLLAFLLTWASDVGGYSAGVTLGKNKLAPSLSPNKTWEGAWGSILFCIIISLAYFRIPAFTAYGSAYVILLALTVSMTAQMGDLFMSGIKRFFDVKDSGSILPGHGGILDRFDSFMVVIPVVYYFFK